MENKINTRIVPMLLELGFEDRRVDKNSREIYITTAVINMFDDKILSILSDIPNVLKTKNYTFDGTAISRDGIDYEFLEMNNITILDPVFEEIEKIIKEEENEEILEEYQQELITNYGDY